MVFWRHWIPENPELEKKKHLDAVALYNKARANMTKLGRKLILVNQGLLHKSPFSRLNNDVVDKICSFLSGTTGTLRTQLGYIEKTYREGTIL